jgi:elongation factor 1-alpha
VSFKSQEKLQVLLAVCGDVGAGRATLSDRLQFELDGMDERAREQLHNEALGLGMSKASFALFLARQSDERARGVTIASTVSHFFGARNHFVFTDSPEHRNFVAHVISGCAQPDVALLVVPADGNFSMAVAEKDRATRGPEGQSRAHARVLQLLGVKRLIVAVNKMDDAKYGRERFEEIVGQVVRMLSATGWGTEDAVRACIPIVPVSARQGDNVVKPSANMAWWTGAKVRASHVHTLRDALDEVSGSVVDPPGDAKAPLRIPVSGVYTIKGMGILVTGRVAQGTVKVGMEVTFVPSQSWGQIGTVELHHRQLPECGPGFNIGMHVKGLRKENMPQIGDVVVARGSDFEAARMVEARVYAFHEIRVGDVLTCIVATGKTLLQVVHCVRLRKSFVSVTLEATTVGVPCESVTECSEIAKIGLRSNGVWIALGNVTTVERWSVRHQRARCAALFVVWAFRAPLSKDVAHVVAELVFGSRAERVWSVLPQRKEEGKETDSSAW